MTGRVAGLTALALACFAGNSILCRLALAKSEIDAASFTVVRLGSGAVFLVGLSAVRGHKREETPRSWGAAGALFAYAAPFSFAYLRLGAAMGALVLFATVQVSMLAWAVLRGERPSARAWLGILLAALGLVGLTLPGRSAPDPLGTAGMAAAGVAWAVYSLRGRVASGDPIVTTTASFVRSLPFAAALVVVAATSAGLHATPRGIALAVASGAVASGAGYSVWYAALRHLSATHAAVLQLLTPVLAAIGAVLLLGEHLSARLVLASATILGGVGLTIASRRRGS